MLDIYLSMPQKEAILNICTPKQTNNGPLAAYCMQRQEEAKAAVNLAKIQISNNHLSLFKVILWESTLNIYLFRLVVQDTMKPWLDSGLHSFWSTWESFLPYSIFFLLHSSIMVCKLYGEAWEIIFVQPELQSQHFSSLFKFISCPTEMDAGWCTKVGKNIKTAKISASYMQSRLK